MIVLSVSLFPRLFRLSNKDVCLVPAPYCDLFCSSGLEYNQLGFLSARQSYREIQRQSSKKREKKERNEGEREQQNERDSGVNVMTRESSEHLSLVPTAVITHQQLMFISFLISFLPFLLALASISPGLALRASCSGKRLLPPAFDLLFMLLTLSFPHFHHYICSQSARLGFLPPPTPPSLFHSVAFCDLHVL